MEKEITPTTWVYIVVQNPGSGENIVGQVDSELNISFIPAFSDKEDAQKGRYMMTTEKGNKYEVQAIIYEDLAKYASENGFLIFMLDEDGKVIQKLTP